MKNKPKTATDIELAARRLVLIFKKIERKASQGLPPDPPLDGNDAPMRRREAVNFLVWIAVKPDDLHTPQARQAQALAFAQCFKVLGFGDALCRLNIAHQMAKKLALEDKSKMLRANFLSRNPKEINASKGDVRVARHKFNKELAQAGPEIDQMQKTLSMRRRALKKQKKV